MVNFGGAWKNCATRREEEEEEEEDRNFQRIFFNYLRSEMREKFNCTAARGGEREREREGNNKKRGREGKKKNFEIN